MERNLKKYCEYGWSNHCERHGIYDSALAEVLLRHANEMIGGVSLNDVCMLAWMYEESAGRKMWSSLYHTTRFICKLWPIQRQLWLCARLDVILLRNVMRWLANDIGVAVDAHKSRIAVCWHCNKSVRHDCNLRQCGRCKVARYCSRMCQENDYGTHAKGCAACEASELQRVHT